MNLAGQSFLVFSEGGSGASGGIEYNMRVENSMIVIIDHIHSLVGFDAIDEDIRICMKLSNTTCVAWISWVDLRLS